MMLIERYPYLMLSLHGFLGDLQYYKPLIIHVCTRYSKMIVVGFVIS